MWAGQDQRRGDGCDVVVVGAGLVGAAVAARLVREGFDTAVLEAQGVADGATGRSAGMVLTGLPGHYNWAVSTYGRERAQETWRLTVEGREQLSATARRLGVPIEHTGSLALAVDDAEAQALEESAALLEEDGFNVEFDPKDPLERGFRAALRYPDDLTVDATTLTWALLADSRVTIHERTEIRALEPEPDGVRIEAQERTVFCSGAVLAVNGYAPLLDDYFADKVAPVRSLVLATEPLSAAILEQPCCADYGYEYGRQLPDGRLLLGSWRRLRFSDSTEYRGTDQEIDPSEATEEGLLRFALHHFPEVGTYNADRYSGTMGFTPDGLPLIGSLPDLPRAYFGVGLGGRGLAWAFVVAERLVELMLRDTAPGILSAARLG
jgi:gamma-glutamylputrescine oxidase